MDAYDRCTNLKKNLANGVAIYARGREIFRPPTYLEIQTFLKNSATLNGIQTFFILITRELGGYCDIYNYVSAVVY